MNKDLKEMLSWLKYERKSGQFIWIKNYENKQFLVSRVAGYVTHLGYRRIIFKQKCYLVHRLVWFVEKSEWPDIVDPINGERDDNRISNLRSVSARQNSQNSHRHRKGHLVGTSFYKGTGHANPWIARIWWSGKMYNLGVYKTQKKAYKVYLAANKLINKGDHFGFLEKFG